jgi:hypothetical protein
LRLGRSPCTNIYLAAFIGVLDAALGYLEAPIFGLYDTLMILGIAALSVFLLRGGREYFDRLGPRVLYLGGLGFLLENFGAVAYHYSCALLILSDWPVLVGGTYGGVDGGDAGAVVVGAA